ncbi:MAG: hypothetical protein U0787_20530 [Polyangia bacterium]
MPTESANSTGSAPHEPNIKKTKTTTPGTTWVTPGTITLEDRFTMP